MDFNTIYETVAPYLGTSGIGMLIIGILYVFIKYRGVIKNAEVELNSFLANIKKSWENTENEALNAFKKALPQDFSINIEALARKELEKVKDYLNTSINNNWLNQVTANNELTRAMANALLSMKSIPDSDKKEIGKLLSLPEVKTTESLVIECLKVEDKPVEAQPSLESIAID